MIFKCILLQSLTFQAGHVCGDDLDLIDGQPTGAVRVSFGYMSTLEDAQRCLQFIVDCFLESTNKPVFCKKKSGSSLTQSVLEKFEDQSENRLSKKESGVWDKKEIGVWDKNENRNKISVEDALEKTDAEKQMTDAESTLDSGMSTKIHSEHEGVVFESCQGRQLCDIYLYPVKSCAAFKVCSI